MNIAQRSSEITANQSEHTPRNVAVQLFDRLNSFACVSEEVLDRRFALTITVAALFVAVCQTFLVLSACPQIPSADGITYYLKAREIASGNWIPILSHEIGLPVLLSPLVAATSSWSLERQLPMLAAFIGLFGALSVPPVAWLARRWFGTTWIIATAVWISVILRNGYQLTGLFTEPPFIAATMFAFAFAISSDHWWRAVVAGAFAGVSTWIRPNGLFVVAIVVVIAALGIYRKYEGESSAIQRARVFRIIGIVVLTWLLVASPKFWMRIETFGAPTDYGPNSHYFSEHYGEVWNDNIPAIGFLEFVSTTGPATWIEQFVAGGAVPAFFAFIGLFHAERLPYTLLLVIGLATTIVRRRPIPLFVAIVVWWIGLAFVWRAFPFPRHWWGVAPFGAMLIAVGITAVLQPHRWSRLWLGLASVIFLVHGAHVARADSLVWSASGRFDNVRPVAEAIIHDVSGVIASNKGQWDLVLFDPTSTIGGRAQGWYETENLTTIRMPYTDSLDSVFAYLRERDVTHIMVDGWRWREAVKNTPALSDLYNDGDVERGELAVHYLELVYNSFGESDRWPVRIYRVLDNPYAGD